MLHDVEVDIFLPLPGKKSSSKGSPPNREGLASRSFPLQAATAAAAAAAVVHGMPLPATGTVPPLTPPVVEPGPVILEPGPVILNTPAPKAGRYGSGSNGLTNMDELLAGGSGMT